MDDLPDDLLVYILRRLQPRNLAVCRGVCKDWRAAVDAGGMLLAVAHRVPRSLHGIFINYVMNQRRGFFSRAARRRSPPCIDGALRFLPGQLWEYGGVLDHRNGLLLVYQKAPTIYVCNPATRRWATLPPPPVDLCHPLLYRHRMYLMFDPIMSLHYDVLFFPEEPDKPKIHSSSSVVYSCTHTENLPPSLRADYERECNTIGSMEWPPYSYAVQVFSSRTNQWEERHYIREGDAAVTVSDMWRDPARPTSTRRRYAVYWRGALYVHFHGGFVVRLSLPEEKYRVIKTPRLHTPDKEEYNGRIKTYGYLGKSNNGVYYTAIHGFQLQVWILREVSESHRMPEWEVKHQANLEPTFARHYNRHNRGEKIVKSWILDLRQEGSEDREDHEWDSSDDSVVDAEEEGIDNLMGYENRCYGVDFLGYHPYKEIAFLGNRFNGFAYYLGSSKLQYLGPLYPTYGLNIPRYAPTIESFIYTPCVDDLLPAHNDAS